MERWKIMEPGHIRWDVAGDNNLPHDDHIEMSGQRCSLYVRYGVDGQRRLHLAQTVMFPGLRTIPNDTHASLLWECGQDVFPRVDNAPPEPETVKRVAFDGVLTITGRLGDIRITRRLLPSREGQYALQAIAFENTGDTPHSITLSPASPEYARGCHGVYVLERRSEGINRSFVLAPGQGTDVTVYFTGRRADESCPVLSAATELALRRAFKRDRILFRRERGGIRDLSLLCRQQAAPRMALPAAGIRS